MKALLLEEIGKLNNKDMPVHTTSEDEVLVNIKACGICGSDIPRAYQTSAHKMPLIIGHEFAGVIEEADANGNFTEKKVGVFPLIPCGECVPCKMKKFEMCRNYSYLGSRRDGGFAEYVAVPRENLIELSDSVDMRAAAMLEPMAVAVHACRQLGILSGNEKTTIEGISDKKETSDKEENNNQNQTKSIVICGMGTIGLLILMFLIEVGYENITVIGNRKLQRQKAIELGLPAERFIMLGEQDSDELIDSIQADYYFECVGKQETYEQAVNHTAPAGKICLVGNPYGDMELPRDIYWKILRNQLTITGTWNSSFTSEADDDWHYVVDRLESGRIHPECLISHSYGMDDIIKGFELMRDKSEDYIKVMMVVD